MIALKGRVKGSQLVDVVNQAQDSVHTFRAKLKRGPEPVEE